MKTRIAPILALCVLLLSACGRPAAPADQSILILYDLYVKGDATRADELSLNPQELEGVTSTFEQALFESVERNFTDNGLSITEEQVRQIIGARAEGIRRLTAHATIGHEDGRRCTVILQTSWFDEASLDARAVSDALIEAKGLAITEQEALVSKATELYIANLITRYQALEPNESMRTITADCVLLDDVWLPEDIVSFASRLANAVSASSYSDEKPASMGIGASSGRAVGVGSEAIGSVQGDTRRAA